jgi:hypothetical protein
VYQVSQLCSNFFLQGVYNSGAVYNPTPGVMYPPQGLPTGEPYMQFPQPQMNYVPVPGTQQIPPQPSGPVSQTQQPLPTNFQPPVQQLPAEYLQPYNPNMQYAPTGTTGQPMI